MSSITNEASPSPEETLETCKTNDLPVLCTHLANEAMQKRGLPTFRKLDGRPCSKNRRESGRLAPSDILTGGSVYSGTRQSQEGQGRVRQYTLSNATSAKATKTTPLYNYTRRH